MMFGNQFDGNAAFSGGGFMPSQATQTADTSYSPAKNRESQALVPLTVKQISGAFLSNADKSNFVVDNVEVNNVTIVGMVCNKAERITDVSFVIDDGTGRMECSRWLNDAVDLKEMAEISDGMYVRVHGHLKAFQGKKQFIVFSVKPLTDYNEIAYHFTECMCVHLYNTRQQTQNRASTEALMPNPNMTTPLKGSQAIPSYQAAPSNQFSGNYSMNGLDLNQKMILDYLQQPSSISLEKGVHRNELTQRLRLPLQKILEAMEYLEAEGLVYSTIDECHYKSTGNA